MLASTLIYLSFGVFIKDKRLVDCLLVSLSLPNLFLVIWTGSIAYQLTPLLVGQYSKGKLDLHFCRALLGRLLALIVILWLSLLLGRPLLIQILVPGFDQAKKDLVAGVLTWALFLVPLQLSISTFNSVYITINRNVFVAVSTLLGSIITVSLLFYFRADLNPITVVKCMIVGNLLTSGIFIFTYFRKYYVKKPGIEQNFGFPKIFKRIAVVIVMLTVSRSVGLIQNAFASQLSEGSIALLTYCNYFMSVIISVLITPILNIYYSRHCESWFNDDKESLFRSFKGGLLMIMIFVIITGSLLLICSDYLNLTIASATHRIDFSINTHVLWLLFFSTSCLLTSAFLGRLFYIADKFRVVNFIDLVNVIFYTGLTFFSSKYYGIEGIFISFSIYSLSTVIWYIVILKKKMAFNISIHFLLGHKNLLLALSCLLFFCAIIDYILYNALLKVIIGIGLVVIGGIFYILKKPRYKLNGYSD
jgi:putative peptidoglycan lipid II flippase